MFTDWFFNEIIVVLLTDHPKIRQNSSYFYHFWAEEIWYSMESSCKIDQQKYPFSIFKNCDTAFFERWKWSCFRDRIDSFIYFGHVIFIRREGNGFWILLPMFPLWFMTIAIDLTVLRAWFTFNLTFLTWYLFLGKNQKYTAPNAQRNPPIADRFV